MTRCHTAAAEEDDERVVQRAERSVGGKKERESEKAREFERSNYNRVRVRESHDVIIMNT